MAETERHETTAPQNPPQSVTNPRVRRVAFWSSLGSIVAFCAIAALVLISRDGLGPRHESNIDLDIPSAVGTTGTSTPGGGDPAPAPGSPREEIEERSGAVLTDVGEIMDPSPKAAIGRRIELTDVDVDRVEGSSVWVRDGQLMVEVVAPPGGPSLKPGQQVDITGVVEARGDTARIRASEVTVRNY